MTALTAVGLPPAKGRSGFSGALRSEWTKIRSVRSTVYTLLATAIVTIGISTLFAWGQSGHTDTADLSDFDPVRNSMFGIVFGQLVIVVIGAMTLSSEYTTGMIRTSLTSMPRRGVVSKVHVHSFRDGVRQSATTLDLHTTLSQPHVLQGVVGGGMYLAVSALLAFGLAALLRHTAGAITAAIAVLFVTFIMSQFLPHDWATKVDKWVPFFAGSQIWGIRKLGDNDIPMLSAWAGFGVFTAYAAVAIIIGAILFRKRDA
ncbi:MAG: hypothetical protein AUG49_04010 [Catenulispora sp. 13_1_20CM_3_70_7]|nr:MAG: hypothetical protein AUG49_04010 [Catenulispora sp. 13_1_20CM_3_70_7]